MPPTPAAARSRRIVEDRPGCPSAYHNSRTAYDRHGCRCDDTIGIVIAYRKHRTRIEKRRAAGLDVPNTFVLVPSLGTARRLQALAADGHSSADLAALLPCSEQWIRAVRHGRTTGQITAVNAEAIAVLFNQLPPRPVDRRGPRLVAEVRRNGWAPSAAWFDVDIDDPAAEPGHLAPTLTDSERCDDCREPMVHRRYPSDDVPEGFVRSHARGLCRGCYKINQAAGTLDRFDPKRRDPEFILNAWTVFREEGCTVAQAAEALDMDYEALRGHLSRARQRGDLRGAVTLGQRRALVAA